MRQPEGTGASPSGAAAAAAASAASPDARHIRNLAKIAVVIGMSTLMMLFFHYSVEVRAPQHRAQQPQREPQAFDQAAPEPIFLRGHPEGRFDIPDKLLFSSSASSASLRPPPEKRSARLRHMLSADASHLLTLVQVSKDAVHAVRTEVDPGLRRSAYVPRNSFALYASRADLDLLQSHANVTWIGHMRPEWKHDPSTLAQLEEDAARQRATPTFALGRHPHLPKYRVTVVLAHPSAASAAAAEWTAAHGFRFSASGRRGRVKLVDSARARRADDAGLDDAEALMGVIRSLRDDERVLFIEVQAVPMLGKGVHNAGGAASMQGGVGAKQPTKLWDKGLDGKGEIIHVHDSGLDMSHCLFSDPSEPPLTPCTDCTLLGNYVTFNATLVGQLAQQLKQAFCTVDFWGTGDGRPFKNVFETTLGAQTNEFLSFEDSEMRDIICPRYQDPERYSCYLANSTDLDEVDRAWKRALLALDAEQQTNPKRACEEFARELPLASISYRDETTPCVFTSPECTTLQASNRKVKAYWNFANGLAIPGAHGTHVAGSVAGYAADPEDPINRFKGSAFNADLVFSDGSYEGRVVVSPFNVGDLYQWAYDLGARISSNSWGGGENAYTTDAEALDEFLWEHEDFLVFFSAGNAGETGYGSIGEEVNAKNHIVVGAARQDTEYEQDTVLNTTENFHRYKIYSHLCEVSNLRKNDMELFRYLNTIVNRTCMYTFDTPEEMAATYCNGSKIGDDLLWREYACNITTFVGVPGLDQCHWWVLNHAKNAFLGENVEINFESACGRFERTLYGFQIDRKTAGEYHVAPFSSRGPTSDGRIKPDIIAPGSRVVSAYSDGEASNDFECNVPILDPPAPKASIPSLFVDEGTSMATPLLAGTAGLVRQWYREGYHHDGRKNETHRTTPTAALLKATMIASTVPAVGNGIVETPYGNEYTNGRNCSVEAPCSYSGPLNSSTAQNYWAIAGFGNAQLASALWFAGDPHRLHFSDRRFLFPSDRHCYAVDNLKASSYLTAVLVWTDPAASPIAAKALVNDLDLRVTLHSTSAEEEDQIFLGNADYTNSTCRDSLNNVEKVTIRPGGASASSSSSATVVVEASAVVLGAAQNYALVVLLPATAAFEPVPCDDDAMSSTTSADFECDATT